MVNVFVVSSVALLLVSRNALALEKGEILDMSYDFGETTLYWPGGGFDFTITVRGPDGTVPWYEENKFAAAEHGGTHLDAPAHFSEGKLRVHEIPISKLVGPAVRVDISKQASNNRNYQLTTKDLHDWEGINGKIPDGCLLFVYTGWGAFYPDRLSYFGSTRDDTYLDDQGNSLYQFPGIAPEAASWLVSNRQISGIGIDTPSVDYGQSLDFLAHRNLLAANVYGMENVANLDKLPTTGARVHALPMKIRGGSGAPLRIFAMLEVNDYATIQPIIAMIFSVSILIIVFHYLKQ
ncbi:isatin hydrolase-like [Asterias rubens]|uniref:isatin hydrolase-like n=1 Tax=Asterias rubens TaxID=7604 RepID=UPI001455B253|nr:isatin hydrolase-like [Asterias rubens]XP_033647470.1 isatin hydrolase-like [Asterias rubens]